MVIETNTNQSGMYDFQLVFHSNCGPMSCRFQGKRRFLWNISNFSEPLYIYICCGSFLCSFVMAAGLIKLVMPLADGRKSLTIYTFISIQYMNLTGWWTDLISQACWHAIKTVHFTCCVLTHTTLWCYEKQNSVKIVQFDVTVSQYSIFKTKEFSVCKTIVL